MNKTTVAVLALTLTAILASLGYYATQKTSLKATEIPTPVYDLWSHWKVSHGKKYGSQEEQSRLNIFYQNYQKVLTHQSKTVRTYDMGFTKFMDLTPAEFKAKYLGTVPKPAGNVKQLNTEGLAATVDWRTKGAVTPIKDQGQCGSCWAFSTTGSLEGLSFLSGKGLQSFSEQQLVDCSGSYGNEGCNGGLMDNAFGYVKDHGITSEDAYSYTAQDGSCQTDGGAFKIGAWVDVAAGNANQLKAAVAGRPVSVAVDAENWQLYSGGVFSDCSTNLDHGVLAVGYDATSFIVKNSWGTGWGEDGFIRIALGNTCGIANAASYPTA